MAEFPALPLFTDAYLADTTHLSEVEHGRYFLMLVHLWRMPNKRFPNDNKWLARKFSKTVEEVETDLRPLISEFFKVDGNCIWHKRIDKEFAHCRGVSGKRSDAAKARWGKEKGSCKSNAPTPTPYPQENSPPIAPRSTAPIDGVGFDPDPPIELPGAKPADRSGAASFPCVEAAPGIRANGRSEGLSDHPVLELVPPEPSPPAEKAAPAKAVAVSVRQADFERFWLEVPKKVGKDDANRKFLAALKASQVSVDELVGGMRRYAQHVRSNSIEPKYIVNPATWLHQGRWKDELQPRVQAKSKIRAGTDFL